MNIGKFDGIFDPYFCRKLIEDSAQNMQPATVGEGSKKHISPGRKAFAHEFETPKWLHDRTQVLASKVVGKSVSLTSLPSQLVLYSRGCGFMRHRDASKKKFTAVYFLNEGFSGGILKFDSGEWFEAKVGSAVIWENTDDSYHEVTEVIDGSRYVLTSWLV